MTPAELREAVARAISDLHLEWDGDEPEVWDVHRHMADAALRVVREAMREPSDAMADAAIGRVSLHDGATIYHGIWRAMLAASPLREE